MQAAGDKPAACIARGGEPREPQRRSRKPPIRPAPAPVGRSCATPRRPSHAPPPAARRARAGRRPAHRRRGAGERAAAASPGRRRARRSRPPPARSPTPPSPSADSGPPTPGSGVSPGWWRPASATPAAPPRRPTTTTPATTGSRWRSPTTRRARRTAQLLAAFWAAHPAVGAPGPLRTREAVLYAGEAQRARGLASRRAVARAAGERVSTAVVPVGRFWPAEPVNQKAATCSASRPTSCTSSPRADGGRDAFLASAAAAHLNCLCRRLRRRRGAAKRRPRASSASPPSSSRRASPTEE